MRLVSVYRFKDAIEILRILLSERTPDESISHKWMPTHAEHKKFVLSHPYLAWYLIEVEGRHVGAIYLTHQREVGIAIFIKERRRGYAIQAIELLREKHPGKILANINPKNQKSIDFFTGLGAKKIQETYCLE